MLIAETPRLIIRLFTPGDAGALMAVFGDAEVMHYGDGPQTAGWIDHWVERAMTMYLRQGYGPWAIERKAGGYVVGYCGLFCFPDIDGRPEVEIGYRLARAHWGQGLATEAVTAVRDYAFQSLGLPRLICLIDPANTASIRVAEKAGLKYEKDVMLAGYSYADRLYAISRQTISSGAGIVNTL
jgi:[ribosomal protein S5]-alanine N-acetyltransferase